MFICLRKNALFLQVYYKLSLLLGHSMSPYHIVVMHHIWVQLKEISISLVIPQFWLRDEPFVAVTHKEIA